MAVPDLSICIVTYKARAILLDCLASLYRNAPSASVEVIVVDNHSQDGIEETLAEMYPQVRLLVEAGNEGYTRPMNNALRHASGRYLVQLNPDTVILPGALDALVRFMDAHPEVGICTPKVLNRDGSLQKQCRRSAARPFDTITYFSGLSARFPKSRRLAGYLMTYLDEDEINEVEAVSGSCMVIRRAVVEQIGYLDEQFFAYQEDADFCYRARQAGWKVMYMPQAQIVHFGGQGGSAVEMYRSVYHWHRSYYRYYRKHMSPQYPFVVNWFFYGAMGGKLLLALAATAARKNALPRAEFVGGGRQPGLSEPACGGQSHFAPGASGGFAPLQMAANLLAGWRLVLACLLLGVLLGSFLHQLRPPQYEATFTIHVVADEVRSGNLTQFEEDMALNAAGNLLLSTAVMQDVAALAGGDDRLVEWQDLQRMVTAERRWNEWRVRLLHEDPQLLARVAGLWVQVGQSALDEAYQHALAADRLARAAHSLETCPKDTVSVAPVQPQCAPAGFDAVQPVLAQAGQSLAAERSASRGIYAGLRLAPIDGPHQASRPARYGLDVLAAAGGLIGLLLGAALAQRRGLQTPVELMVDR